LLWPPPPDEARLEYVGAIDCEDLKPAGGFLNRLGRWIGGRAESDILSLPFDVVVVNQSLFVVCQNLPALVEIDPAKGTFRTHTDKKKAFMYPVSLCHGGDGAVFVTDPEAAAVFLYSGGKVKPFIETGLVRPTGVAALPGQRRLFVVDTGDQSLKIYDYDGKLLKVVRSFGDADEGFNFPTFAAAVNGQVLVNDALNYQMKRFDSDGNLVSAFGREGDGPGSFSRPKGIAVDSDNHIYVVDNLFDNLQIFDRDGRVLLVIGSAGQAEGQFWSPAGIDIARDTVYVADTYNNRIQILHYLGEDQ
jgi:DNA-binding beta-propeller fold protein YncE